jgi:hypothetical protein
MFCSSTYFDDSGKNNRVPHWAHLIIGRDAKFVVSQGLKVTGGSSDCALLQPASTARGFSPGSAS